MTELKMIIECSQGQKIEQTLKNERNIDDIEIEAEEINKLFWEQGVWNGIKTLMNRYNDNPRKMTYIVTTPQKVYVNYVDLTERKLNTKKIVK